MRGATVCGETLLGQIDVLLRIESLQDRHTADSNQKNIGGSLAVTEQSGLFAGAGGFNLSAKQGTLLKGGVITSSDLAVEQHRNRLETAYIFTEDIENHADYSATGISLGAGYGTDVGKTNKAKPKPARTKPPAPKRPNSTT